MTAMLNSYVSFVKIRNPEPIENINLNKLLKDLISKNIDLKIKITDFLEII